MTITVAIVFVILCAPFVVLGAETGRVVDVTLRIDPRIYPNKAGEPPKTDPVFNRANLIAIQQFILRQGRTQTYCNMYNNNPFFPVGRYSFYLDPDPGGPHNHPQYNGNCDPEKSEFHTLVIRNMDWGIDQYRRIRFKEEHNIYVVVTWPVDELNVGQIRGRAEEAIKAILEEMKRIEEKL